MAFDPYLDWVDVPNPAQPPAGAKMITASDLLRYETGIEQNETDIATTAEALNNKADLVGGKVSVGQLPTEALVTDSSVASQVNSPMTGAAIDARVEPVATSYLASQPAVVDAAAAAVDANPDISSIKSRLTVLDGQGQRGYTVSETAGRVIRVWDYLNQREQLIYGDTEERNIASLFTAGGTHSGFTLRRVGHTCTLTLYNWTPAAAGSGNLTVLPTGFRPRVTYGVPAQGLSSRIQVTAAGNVQAYNWTTATVVASIVWMTSDPWPTSLPGIPV